MRSPPLAWIPALPPPIQLPPATIHVWKTHLSHPFLQTYAAQYLSHSELRRAATYRNTTAQNNFIACRACLRDILSRYLPHTPLPHTIPLQTPPSGKPSLPPPSHHLQFNLSHTANTALIAISSQIPIGVDLESTRRNLSNIHVLIRRKLTPREQTLLLRHISVASSAAAAASLHSTHSLRHALLLMWTRKEAFLKCSGEGIARGLKSVEVSPALCEQDILSVDADPGKARLWSLYNIPVDCAHVASVVAATAQRARLHFFEWSPLEHHTMD